MSCQFLLSTSDPDLSSLATECLGLTNVYERAITSSCVHD